MAKFLIAGSRTRYAPLTLIDSALRTLTPEDDGRYVQHVLISGGAAGVDHSGEKWAEARKHEIMRFPVTDADWRKHGMKAGHIRNADMANVPPDFAFILWDGVSNGTKGMIRLLVQRRIPHLVFVDYEGQYDVDT